MVGNSLDLELDDARLVGSKTRLYAQSVVTVAEIMKS
jgi:hypothetical protein